MEADQIGIERSILHGLAAEWGSMADALPRRLREALQRPRFSLSDAARRLGSWDPAREEIRISRRFALERGWDEVRELLRHEMAHQLADQALDGGAETSHGPAFREACRLVGAHPAASGDFVPLADRLAGDADPARARALARMHKLLALASSRNRHEAELALLRAREFARRHRVGAPGESPPEFLSVFAGRPALRHTREEFLLAALVTRTWEAYGIWVPAWVVDRGRMGTVLELSGTPAQVKLAGYVHEFVRRYIATEWARYDHGRRLGARRRTDFGCGVIEGFRGTLERGNGGGAGEAVVRTGRDPLLAGYLAARYPRRTTIRRGGGRVDPGVHRDGVRTGERLVIREGVEGSTSPRRLLRDGR